MAYSPMTADEAAKLSIRPSAVYPFEVITADDTTSKKGDPMIALDLRFFDTDGSSFSVKDWLVHGANRWTEKKFFDFANTTGLTPKYQAGQMTAEDCLGRNGHAMVGIEEGKLKPDGSGKYKDRNNVNYYTVPSKSADKPAAPVSAAPAGTTQAATENLGEDVPF